MGCLFCYSQEKKYKPNPGTDFIYSRCVQLFLKAEQKDLKAEWVKGIQIKPRQSNHSCLRRKKLMDNENQLRNMNDILTEIELIDLLGIKKSALDDLRYRHRLPFCKISNTNRIYLVKDVFDFIAGKRNVLNKQA